MSDIEKAPDAYRTISEVSDQLDVPQHVLRFWETKFPQVAPLKRAGNRRYYHPDHIGLLERIRDLLYVEGYTTKGVQKLLDEDRLMEGSAPAAPAAPAASTGPTSSSLLDLTHQSGDVPAAPADPAVQTSVAQNSVDRAPEASPAPASFALNSVVLENLSGVHDRLSKAHERLSAALAKNA